MGVTLLLVAVTTTVLILRRSPRAPSEPEGVPARTAEEVQPITLTGLTIEQQITVLRDATTHMAENLAVRYPEEARAHLLLGDVYRRFGRSAEAMACWQKAADLAPDWASPFDRMAIVAMEKGQFDEAISWWQRVLALNPASPGIHDKMGRVLMASGRQDEAIAALKEEIRISPTSAPTYYLLGQAYLQNKQYEQAVDYYKKALELSPDLPNVHYGLATAYARLRQPALAQQYRDSFRRLSADDPEERPYGFSPQDDLVKARADFVGHALRAASLQQAQGRMSDAEALLRRAAAVDPNHADCRKRLAAFYRSAGKLPQALAQCEQVARLEPNDPTCRLLIATLALQLQQRDKAEAAFKKLVALAPRESVGYRELARLYLASDAKLNEAKRLAQKAVELAPAAANYYVLGLVCQRSGDRDSALAALRQAIQLDPGNAEYRRAYNMMETRR
ncbi:MAG: tetratricopeptide repeat protein [Phycisphaerales bacterium]|nr:MAG: tetratricopeptide repeat protein [Phycisphaerales bacterium]